MANLSNRCRASFDSGAVVRGSEYYRLGNVKFKNFSDDVAQFGVKSSNGNTYPIELNWSGLLKKGELVASCGCPHYERGNTCKHIWASLMWVDASPFSAKVSGNSKVTVTRPSETEDPLAAGAEWEKALDDALGSRGEKRGDSEKNPLQVLYSLNIAATRFGNAGIVLDLWSREMKSDDDWGPLKELRGKHAEIETYENPLDREVLTILLPSVGDRRMDLGVSRVSIPQALAEPILRRIALENRLFATHGGYGSPDLNVPIIWSAERYDLEIDVCTIDEFYELKGFLRGDSDRVDLDEVACFLVPDLIIFKDRIAKLSRSDVLNWVKLLRKGDSFRVPKEQGPILVEKLLGDVRAPKISWPEELRWDEVSEKPPVQARVIVSKSGRSNGLRVLLSFHYGDDWVNAREPGHHVLRAEQKKIFVRDEKFEKESLEKVAKSEDPGGIVPFDRSGALVADMISWGWQVEAEGKPVVSSTSIQTKVSSGVDWFDLSAEVQYGKTSVGLQQLIDCLDRGEKWIKLEDGSFGMIPEQWVKNHAALVNLGEDRGKTIRFSSVQALLLEGWLQEEGSVQLDGKFEEFRERVRGFKGLKPKAAHKTFKGTLRPYQEEGLSWLTFLSDFGLGGVLADDMGLGKTIQVLAFLQDRVQKRVKGDEGKPTLVIAPKSLVHNWIDESSKFAPNLKILNYTGSTRKDILAEFPKADLILTTYPTMRLDIDKLREFDFDCVIIDEAQAIKNANSQVAKAVRLIRGRHKIAMTGTPVENRLEDLFSILDFINPGLITRKLRAKFSEGGPQDAETMTALSRALRPIIFRRTKKQVLKDLPEKTEQTLLCELSDQELKTYQGLRDHYRQSLDDEIGKSGIGKSRIQILTALLRLRQAACHPGLLDSANAGESSAKLETLLEQMQEIIQEGHKVLVFSQFTSFLDIVRKRLQSENIDFEYLDGKTKNRKEVVDRFQSESSCQVFLLSLKAGGTGLNLTAADYVFLLDPWWNPAVEAQAIDRAHRIGQHRNVFAYRLIARGTVEEKILELQKTKRDLADAIISEDANFLKKMTREDLQLLLS